VLDDASLFIDAVRAGGVRALARERGVPRSTVSRALSRLEAALGVTLVARTTGRMKLTQAGEESFERLAAAVDEARGVLGELGASGREVRGLLRVTATPVVSEALLPQVLAAFLEAHPLVRVEVLPSSERLDLEASRVDVAIRAGAPPDSDRFTARRWASLQLGFYASSKYLRGRKIESVDALTDLLVTQRAAASWLLGGESRRVTGRVHADDLRLLMALCERGVGIARLPVKLAAPAVREGRLEPVLEPAWLSAELQLVYRLKPPERVKAFVAACLAVTA